MPQVHRSEMPIRENRDQNGMPPAPVSPAANSTSRSLPQKSVRRKSHHLLVKRRPALRALRTLSLTERQPYLSIYVCLYRERCD
jgi:hypothetical protein